MLGALILAAASTVGPFDQVVAAERAFAADAPVKGLHGAFLDHLAPDAVVFDPVPAPGIAAHRGKPQAKGNLSWGPAWVAAPAHGDLAFSSGPWEYRLPGEGAPPPGTGWFLSVWRRQVDGAWKVRADIGISCALAYAPPEKVEDGLGASPPAEALGRGGAAEAHARLAAEEARLDAAAADGVGRAVLARAGEDLRVYRDGACPAVGRPAARAALERDARALSCRPDRIEIDATGALGYAYGTCRAASGGETGFLRVWRRTAGGAYEVLVDAVLDVPEKK